MEGGEREGGRKSRFLRPVWMGRRDGEGGGEDLLREEPLHARQRNAAERERYGGGGGAGSRQQREERGRMAETERGREQEPVFGDGGVREGDAQRVTAIRLWLLTTTIARPSGG